MGQFVTAQFVFIQVQPFDNWTGFLGFLLNIKKPKTIHMYSND